MTTKKVTRLEIIDHTICKTCTGQGGTEDVWCGACGGTGMRGRTVVFWDAAKEVKLSLQDDGRTLKIFIEERGSEKNTTNK